MEASRDGDGFLSLRACWFVSNVLVSFIGIRAHALRLSYVASLLLLACQTILQQLDS